MYYGSYQYDTSFKTYDQYTDFLLAAAGAITNLKRLDLTKEIRHHLFGEQLGYREQQRSRGGRHHPSSCSTTCSPR